jgi:chromosome partitioning protein
MHVLMLATQKGGAGKSTLAAALAVAAQADGERVLAVDLDPQGSLWSWRQRRSDDAPETVRGDAADLPALLEAARLRSATLAVVDTPGLFGAAVTTALARADLVLVPVKPSILDVEATRPTVEQLKRLGKPFAFVLNQCAPSSQARTLDAATALVRSGSLAPSMVAVRADFLDAMTAGLGVTELGSRSKASQEITLLWHWLKTQLAGEKARAA